MPVPHPRPGPHATGTEIRLDARIVLTEEQSLDIPVRFGYSTADPFAVALEFLGPAAHAGTWRFARDLLWTGLHKPAGLGDVRVWPPCPCHDRPHLRIKLQAPDGSILLDLPPRPLRRWLRQATFPLVPRGTEGAALDWDTALRDLTAGQPPGGQAPGSP
ncbi:SsgA family sporulation/cell division regulator [Kitasatospora sp. NPDC004531]